VLEFVKAHNPGYKLPLDSVHPCTTCLHLYHDEAALQTIKEHYREVEDQLIERYLAELALTQFQQADLLDEESQDRYSDQPIPV